jgi:hypothetical protein
VGRPREHDERTAGALLEAAEKDTLCERLAALELRGVIPEDEGARIWHDARSALLTGFATPPPRTSPRRIKQRYPANGSGRLL